MKGPSLVNGGEPFYCPDLDIFRFEWRVSGTKFDAWDSEGLRSAPDLIRPYEPYYYDMAHQ